MMGACALTLGACVDEVPSDDFGPSPAVESNGVYFPNTMQTSYELGEANEPAEVTEKTGSFTLPVERTNPDQAVTIEVTTEMDAETAAVFSVPTSVTFEAGSATSELVVNYTAAQRGVTYKLNISFGEGTEYAASYQTITALFPALEIWEPVSTEAVFVDQMFSIFGVGDITFKDLTVEKLQGKCRYRFLSPYDNQQRFEDTDGSVYSYFGWLGLPLVFPAEFEFPYIILDGEAYLPAKDDGSREYTDEELAELDESKRLYYIAPTGLGFQMQNGGTAIYDPTWNTFGSFAYNLSSGGTQLTEEDNALGSYNKSKEMFDFGSVYHQLGDGSAAGGFAEITGMQLWLNPAKMTVVYDRDYQPWNPVPDMAGTFISEVVGEQYTVTVDQGTLPEGETDPIYRLVSPYAEGTNIAFFHNMETGTLRVPKGQATGMTAFGNAVYVDVTKASYDAETATYTFECTFYYNMKDGDSTVKATLQSTTEVFRSGWFPLTLDTMIPGTIDDFVGTYDVVFDYYDGSNPSVLSSVTLTKIDEYTLVAEGLAPYMAAAAGWEPGFKLSYDPDQGLVAAMAQNVAAFQGVSVRGWPANLSVTNMDPYNVLIGGFDSDGNLVFLNSEDNSYECTTIFFLDADGYIVDPYLCQLTWTPVAASEAAAASAQQLKPMKEAMQFERLVRQFMPKFGKPVVTSSTPKLVKSIEGVQTQRFEMVKK